MNPPLFKGGQGRSDTDILNYATAIILMVAAAIIVTVIVASLGADK